jgi:hypothetical protein
MHDDRYEHRPPTSWEKTTTLSLVPARRSALDAVRQACRPWVSLLTQVSMLLPSGTQRGALIGRKLTARTLR